MTSSQKEAGIRHPDVGWLAGANIAGGIMAPIVLMVGLQVTPASTASLLLNFEGVATTLIALLFFGESITRRAFAAILAITLTSIFLSTNLKSGMGFSLGALGILLACTLWGLDNNFTECARPTAVGGRRREPGGRTADHIPLEYVISQACG